jgi:hypothetical protein
MAQTSITDYASNQKRKIDSEYGVPPTQILRLYTGNEASDADSIFSATCFGYLSSKYLYSQDSTRTHVSIVSIPHQDLKLKGDIKLLLSEGNLITKDLLTFDELEEAKLAQFQAIEVVLLDHNLMIPKLQQKLDTCGIPWSVTQILDHHQDAGEYPSVTGLQRLIAFNSLEARAEAGSTCSLVIEYFHFLGIPIPWSEEPLVAIWLLSVILLDTYHDNPLYQKNTFRDNFAKSFLLDSCIPLQQTWPSIDYQKKIYQQLVNAKFDPIFWNQLTAQDCLRYDYKLFVQSASIEKDHHQMKIGTASVLLPLNDFLLKEDIKTTVCDYFTNPAISIDLLAVLSLVFDPQQIPHRQLLLFSTDSHLLDQFQVYHIQSDIQQKYPLQLQLFESGNLLISEKSNSSGNTNNIAGLPQSIYYLFFRQENNAATRKQIAPLLMEFVQTFLNQK